MGSQTQEQAQPLEQTWGSSLGEVTGGTRRHGDTVWTSPGAQCRLHAGQPSDSFPTPAGSQGLCRKLELEGLRPRDHLAHGREERGSMLKRGECTEILQTEMKLWQPHIPQFQERCDPGTDPGQRTASFFFGEAK